MASPLPIDQPWYRQLLALAVVVGGVLALLGLGYLGLTGAITDRVFGTPRIDAWSGDWWWIPYTAAGGLADRRAPDLVGDHRTRPGRCSRHRIG